MWFLGRDMASLLRVVILLSIACWNVDASYELAARFEWKQVDFDYPNETVRAEAVKNGEFIPRNNAPLGVERWRNKLFVTIPRLKIGTAATLAYIDLNTQEKSPKLKPYPNWDAHKIRENNGVAKITSVYRLHVDVCDRLWLLDTGLNDILDKNEKLYDPKIQVYDLNTDRLVREYTLPKDVIRDNSLFVNIIADVNRNDCEGAFAYVADLESNALIVCDMQHGDSYRITHHFFNFDPLSGDYNIGGDNFQWPSGIFGLALSPLQKDGFRTLYFHPMSSTHEFAVSTRIIRNKTIASNSYHEYKVLGSRGPNAQSLGSSIDEATGVLLYTLHHKNAIGCWNIYNPEYSADTNAVLARNDETMNFPTDLKVDKNGILWVLTDKLRLFGLNKLNYNEVNFRIFDVPVKDIVKGTVCDETRVVAEAKYLDQPVEFQQGQINRPPWQNRPLSPAAPWEKIPLERQTPLFRGHFLPSHPWVRQWM
ncbi:hypothetical protein V9T40_011407 [Parthenolecanium corni]|uniref:Protein yellow n=1 Tax=Parthenolecanium corni TaxID=536013 RepID=A0AAN9TK31_9HEMI